MTHWMDADRFDDTDGEEERPRAWDPLTLIAAQLETRFSPLGPWIAEAACNGQDPTLWDAPPTSQELAEMAPAERPSARDSARRQREAAAICHTCPVREACLADARANDATHSVIRGGVLFVGRNGNTTADTPRAEHDLISLMHGGHLNAAPAGRGRPVAA